MVCIASTRYSPSTDRPFSAQQVFQGLGRRANAPSRRPLPASDRCDPTAQHAPWNLELSSTATRAYMAPFKGNRANGTHTRTRSCHKQLRRQETWGNSSGTVTVLADSKGDGNTKCNDVPHKAIKRQHCAKPLRGDMHLRVYSMPPLPILNAHNRTTAHALAVVLRPDPPNNQTKYTTHTQAAPNTSHVPYIAKHAGSAHTSTNHMSTTGKPLGLAVTRAHQHLPPPSTKPPSRQPQC